MELQLNLDFDDGPATSVSKKVRKSQDQIRRKNAAKRSEQKKNYDKWKKINSKKATNKEKTQERVLTGKSQPKGKGVKILLEKLEFYKIGIISAFYTFGMSLPV